MEQDHFAFFANGLWHFVNDHKDSKGLSYAAGCHLQLSKVIAK